MIAFSGKATDSDDWIQRIDLTSIAFPSDNISIKTLRKFRPDLFDIGFEDENDNQQPKYLYDSRVSHTERLAEVLYYERLIAVQTYAKARGLDSYVLHEAAPEDVAFDDLTTLYLDFGIAAGKHHAEQLIRDVQRQARQLAEGLQP